MKIGILLCGDVPPELIKEFGSYTDCLTTQLNLNQYDSVKVWDLYQSNHLPENVYQCDAYIVGGSPSGVNDDLNWIHRLTSFIRKAFHAQRKLLGICFGHQVIHHALGGEVQKSNKGWGLGAYDVQLKEDIGELKAGQTMQLIAIHQDQVIKPGKGFEVLASNEFCPYYLTRYQDQILTVQGHPEFSGDFFNALLMLRADKFKPDEIQKAQVKDESLICNNMFNHFANNFLARNHRSQSK